METMSINQGALSRKKLHLLIVFSAVAETRSVSAAADRLSLSQPAVSHSLGKLRLMFDDRLFVRRHNALVLTPRAEKLVQPVRNFLANAEAVLMPPVRAAQALPTVAGCRAEIAQSAHN